MWDELKLSKDEDSERGESVAMFYLIYHHGQEAEERGVRLPAELMEKGRRRKGSGKRERGHPRVVRR